MRLAHVADILINALVVVLVGGITLLVAVATLPVIAELDPIAIRTSGMEPALKIGDMVIVKAVDSSTLGVEDVVIYENDAGPVVRRIDEVQQTVSGRYFFMMGDASYAEGELVRDTQVIAKVIYRFPKLGFLATLADDVEWNIYLFLSLTATLMFKWAHGRSRKHSRDRHSATQMPFEQTQQSEVRTASSGMQAFGMGRYLELRPGRREAVGTRQSR